MKTTKIIEGLFLTLAIFAIAVVLGPKCRLNSDFIAGSSMTHTIMLVLSVGQWLGGKTSRSGQRFTAAIFGFRYDYGARGRREPVLISALAFSLAHLILIVSGVGILFLVRILVFTFALGLIASYYQENTTTTFSPFLSTWRVI